MRLLSPSSLWQTRGTVPSKSSTATRATQRTSAAGGLRQALRKSTRRETGPLQLGPVARHAARQDAPTGARRRRAGAIQVETDSIEEPSQRPEEQSAAPRATRTCIQGEGSGLQYSMLRTPAAAYFPEELFEEFCQELAEFGQKHLGCDAFTPPWLACYTDGHEMALAQRRVAWPLPVWKSTSVSVRVQVDATIQHERAVKFDFHTGPLTFVEFDTARSATRARKAKSRAGLKVGRLVLLRPEIPRLLAGLRRSKGLEAGCDCGEVEPGALRPRRLF